MRRPGQFWTLDFGFWIAVLAVVGVSAACNTPTETTAPVSPSPAATSSPVASPAVSPSPAASVAGGKAESLVGRWSGTGETSLNITKKGDKYTIEIAGSMGPKTYEGTAKGDGIEFIRNGKTETLKAGSGVDAGIKGFEKETNCVVITKGTEGFCKK